MNPDREKQVADRTVKQFKGAMPRLISHMVQMLAQQRSMFPSSNELSTSVPYYTPHFQYLVDEPELAREFVRRLTKRDGRPQARYSVDFQPTEGAVPGRAGIRIELHYRRLVD